MKVGELIEVLSKYPKDAEVKVLEKLRLYGGGQFADIINLKHSFDQDTGKITVGIETDYESHIRL